MGNDNGLGARDSREPDPGPVFQEGRALTRSSAKRAWSISRLSWSDLEIDRIALPTREMVLRAGFGSGLATRPGDPPGTVWAICDRGPNLKASTLAERYGVDLSAHVGGGDGAKIMPRPDLGPALAELKIDGTRVDLVRTVRITAQDGAPLTGRPMAGSAHAEAEPAFDLDGCALPPDVAGADSEGVVALRNGGFWVSDEYGPSLIKLDSEGRVVARWLPAGSVGEGEPILPAIAGRRKINRGFEALAISPDECWLVLAFQSPLAHPDRAAHKQAGHVRIWRLDAQSGEVTTQHLYPLDPPESFARDCRKGQFALSDIKVSELLWAGADALLVLERGSETTRIYKVRLDPARALGPEHLDVANRPTIEQRSAAGDTSLPELAKELLFDSDLEPQVAADLEGMAWLSPGELLLVSDNDFGVEGAETSFWRLKLGAAPPGG